MICVVNNNKKYNVIKLSDVPITLDGKLSFNIENALAACAALVGIGIDYCMIARGFSKFMLDAKHNSGRFNLYEINERKVILDYGHNTDGYRAIFKALKGIDHNNLIGVIGIPGDRSNDMAKEIGMISSANLDKIIIKEDKDRRGREKGEICNLIKEGIDEEKDCKIILDESEALIEALKISDKGDIIVMFFEQLAPLVKVIKDISDNGMNENIVNM